ncbi:TlpA family protein disulfide reductase [Blastococcus deserti]|uniref:TlpA family protein disulfide reductase n=1 Tax=Blastococcus deserti TaxID=2259033 RepID=A0ABW4X8J1_9ACTN
MRPRTVLAAAAVVLLSACTAERANPDGPVQVESLLAPCPDQPGDTAQGAARLPALSFDCPGGGELDLARAPGVPTIVNLWGSWCAPCREELPLFQELVDLAGDRVRVVGVISKDGAPQAESFAAEAGVVFPSAFDGEGELMAALGINVLPHTYFLDPAGALVHTQVGPVTSVDELRGLVAQHLGVQL